MAAGRWKRTFLRMVGSDRVRPLRVVIVGRRPDVRRALQIRLALERDVTVVGSTSSVEAALPALRGRRPNVLLVDVDLAPEPAPGALGRARALAPGLRVVLLTHYLHDWPGSRLTLAGADDVVDKDPDAHGLLASVRCRSERRQQDFV